MKDPVLCPFDSRRGVSEVFIKRIAVMFAALCLMGHLNSLRGMKDSFWLKMSILLFFMNPLYPLLTFIFDIGWAVFKYVRDARKERWYSLVSTDLPIVIQSAPARPSTHFYIGAAIGMHATYNHTNDPCMSTSNSDSSENSMSILRLPHSAISTQRTSRSRESKRFGRFVVLAAIGVQCSATVLLGIRRIQHGSASPSDRWYFLYAVGGLALLAQVFCAQMLSRSYEVTKMVNVDYVSEHGISVGIEVVHYLISAVGAAVFAGDGLLGNFQVMAGFIALNSVLWPYREMMDLYLPFWKDFWSNPLRTIGEHLFVRTLQFGVPLVAGSFSLSIFVCFSWNPYSDKFQDPWGEPFPSNASCPFLWQDPLANKLWAF